MFAKPIKWQTLMKSLVLLKQNVRLCSSYINRKEKLRQPLFLVKIHSHFMIYTTILDLGIAKRF